METDFEDGPNALEEQLAEIKFDRDQQMREMLAVPKYEDLTIRMSADMIKNINAAIKGSGSKEKKPDFIRKAITEKLLSVEIAERIKDSLGEDLNSLRFLKGKMEASFTEQDRKVHNSIIAMAKQMDDRNKALTQMLEKQADENTAFLTQLMEVFESISEEKISGS